MRDRQGGITQHRTDEADYSTDVIADLAVQRIREAPADQPLFALIAPFTPHEPNLPAPRHEGDARCADLEPWAPPNYDEADVSDKPPYIREAPPLGDGGFDLTAHCESLLAVDELIGRVGDELERAGSAGGHRLRLHRRQRHDLGRAPPRGQGLARTARPCPPTWPGRPGAARAPRDDDTTLSMIDWARHPLRAGAAARWAPTPTARPRPDGLSFAVAAGRRALPVRARVDPAHDPQRRRSARLLVAAHDRRPSRSGRWLYVENQDGFRELYDVSGGPCYEWQSGGDGDPCLLTNLLAGDATADALATADTLAPELAELKVEVAPEPVRKPDG